MLRSTTLATAATLALSALTACGGEPRSDEDKVRAQALDFMSELLHGDTDACDRLSKDGRRQVDSRAAFLDLDGCEAFVKEVEAEYSDADRDAVRKVRIRRVTIEGDRATIRDRDIVVPAELEGQVTLDERPVVLRRQRGEWKLEDVG
jgi:hypothetical protein